jgi:hypothetical protein
MGAMVGARRNVSAISKGLKPKQGMDAKDTWRTHCEGACGEVAVAKVLNLFWDGSIDTFHGSLGSDVGHFHVRTRSEHGYELNIRDDDKDDEAYILATGLAPDFVVRGWQYARLCKQPEFLKDHGHRGHPAYFYPQHLLRELAELWNMQPVTA